MLSKPLRPPNSQQKTAWKVDKSTYSTYTYIQLVIGQLDYRNTNTTGKLKIYRKHALSQLYPY